MLAGSSHVAGIDLGTTNSCISIYKHEKVEVAVDALGARTTPSMVAFTDTGRLFGVSAKNQIIRNYKNTIYDVKRLIGHSFNEPAVQEDIKRWPFTVVQNANGRPVIKVEYMKQQMEFTPEEISSYVIGNLVSIAKKYSEKDITDIVITVPAYFNNSQRQATIDAGTLAGYNVLEVLNEPTAAAIAYGFENMGNKTILVYDLGGGTFDCTILRVEDSVYSVKGTDGDCHLGGDDFDARMMALLKEKLENFGCDTNFNDKRNAQKLRNIAESTKIELSTLPSVEVNGESFDVDPFQVSRAEFEERCMDLFDRTKTILDRLMKSVNMNAGDIDDVVLIGGSSRIPYVKQMLIEMFGEEKVFEKINPDEAVSKGAVIEAVRLMDKKMKELNTSIDPEKIPSVDASNMESGSDSDSDDDDDDDDTQYAPIAIQNIVINQVIPLPIGVKNSEKMMSVILEKNLPYGESRQREYVTSKDNMTSMKIHVYQGERPVAADNYEIGVIKITGITPMPKGQASVVITMSVDMNGVLKMSVLDTTSQRVTEHVFDNKATNLSAEEIERMKEEAVRLQKEDERKVEMLKKKSEIEELVFAAKQAAKDREELLDDEFKQQIAGFFDEIKGVLKNKEVTMEDLEMNKEVCQQWLDAINGTMD